MYMYINIHIRASIASPLQWARPGSRHRWQAVGTPKLLSSATSGKQAPHMKNMGLAAHHAQRICVLVAAAFLNSISSEGMRWHAVIGDCSVMCNVTVCSVMDNISGTGLLVAHQDATCKLTECKFIGNGQGCAVFAAGANVAAGLCQFGENAAGASVVASGAGTFVKLSGSTVMGSGLSGVVVCEGAAAEVENCNTSCCEGHGIEVRPLTCPERMHIL